MKEWLRGEICEECERHVPIVYIRTVSVDEGYYFCRECAQKTVRGLTPGIPQRIVGKRSK